MKKRDKYGILRDSRYLGERTLGEAGVLFGALGNMSGEKVVNIRRLFGRLCV